MSYPLSNWIVVPPMREWADVQEKHRRSMGTVEKLVIGSLQPRPKTAIFLHSPHPIAALLPFSAFQ